ncbi:glycosyltransferase [Candidatus Dependentiae bacterium]|nr:MAG: glycosyltransferase [Candidatus Dependentiae bacterium]
MNYYYKYFFYAQLFVCFSTNAFINQPRVSIITSVYKADEYMKRFFENITQQTIFSECELILINANSPGNEEPIILKYMAKYKNIKYIKLSYDPGVYGVWNIGIIASDAPYITNANLDDLRYADCLERQARFLDENSSIDLVYANFKYSDDPKSDIDHCTIINQVQHVPIINLKKALWQCIPGPQPMWRKDVHQKVGFFDQRFLYSGDWEFWNRMVQAGLDFGQMNGYSGVYYFNPDGLSTNQVPEKVKQRNDENQYIIAKYSNMWNN